MSKTIFLTLLCLIAFVHSAFIQNKARHMLIKESSNVSHKKILLALLTDGTIESYVVESKLAANNNNDASPVKLTPAAKNKVFELEGISMTTSVDGSSVFVSGRDEEYKYRLKEIDVNSLKLVSDYGTYAGDNEQPMVTTNDGKVLITGNDVGGNDARIKIWSIEGKSLTEKYPWGFNYDIGMTAQAITNDISTQYVGSEYGDLQEFDLNKKEWTFNYSKDSKIDQDSNINSMFVTADNKYLFMSNDQGYIKQFDCKNKKLVKNWGIVTPGSIMKVIYHKKTNTFFTSDNERYGNTDPVGNLKRFDVEKQILVKDYGVYVNGGIVDMAIDETSNLIFLAGKNQIAVVDIETQATFWFNASSEIAAVAY